MEISPKMNLISTRRASKSPPVTQQFQTDRMTWMNFKGMGFMPLMPSQRAFLFPEEKNESIYSWHWKVPTPPKCKENGAKAVLGTAMGNRWRKASNKSYYSMDATHRFNQTSICGLPANQHPPWSQRMILPCLLLQNLLSPLLGHIAWDPISIILRTARWGRSP